MFPPFLKWLFLMRLNMFGFSCFYICSMWFVILMMEHDLLIVNDDGLVIMVTKVMFISIHKSLVTFWISLELSTSFEFTRGLWRIEINMVKNNLVQLLLLPNRLWFTCYTICTKWKRDIIFGSKVQKLIGANKIPLKSFHSQLQSLENRNQKLINFLANCVNYA